MPHCSAQYGQCVVTLDASIVIDAGASARAAPGSRSARAQGFAGNLANARTAHLNIRLICEGLDGFQTFMYEIGSREDRRRLDRVSEHDFSKQSCRRPA